MNTGDLEAALTMVRAYEACMGEDPFAPYESMTDFTEQKTEVCCYGCNALGVMAWPDWKLRMKHQPDCKWLAWRRVVENK